MLSAGVGSFATLRMFACERERGEKERASKRAKERHRGEGSRRGHLH